MAGIDTYAKLVLQADDQADASTTITDSSSSPYTVTAAGNAQIDTARHAFAGDVGSILFDGSGDYCTVPDNADWGFGTGDFSIDFWIWASSVATDEMVICTNNLAGETGGWAIRMNDDGTMLIKVQHATSKIVAAHGMSASTWYHIEVTRSGTTLYFFVAGTQITTASSVSDDVAQASAVHIGIRPSLDKPFTGSLDEIRISKGVARHTSNFTPETAPYTVEASGHPAVIRGYYVKGMNRILGRNVLTR